MSVITLEKLLTELKVETTDSQLSVEMPKKKLSVGKHSFNLTVEDDSGNQSSPAVITVIVADTTRPTAVLDLLSAEGRTITDGRLGFGENFRLSGKRSVDVGGVITKFIWEVVPL